ncbi:lytic transglycosylase domain-containing protein [Acidithiobacillus albertensis]|uniref:lytic transglycosylase domain-containing protein n=1 Tax=Acidithiobacillus albertensis TaxID=119978 RepID=UPI001D00D694|nr:lytic transglycosylase domain-containing protein [Acidithiobacillus albertensis]
MMHTLDEQITAIFTLPGAGALPGAVAGVPRLLAVIATVFSVGCSGYAALVHVHPKHPTKRKLSVFIHGLQTDTHRATIGQAVNGLKTIRHLAGPYAQIVVKAAREAHISPRLVAAVVHVENGGNFQGSSNRVSPAGAIGVMQLEPATAWDTLRVNPWNVRQNINGGARYLAMMLRQFHGNVQLALMAYNAGPGQIAQGGRPWAAVAYAQQVIRDAQA